jgi:hypothetical protein
MNKTKKLTMYESIRIDVEAKFKHEFDDYFDLISEEKIALAIDDVLETSGAEEEGCYSDGDIILAFQRVMSGYIS